MEEKPALLNKTLVVGVMVIFIGVSIAPSINADVDRRFTKPFTNPIFDETVKVTISRYKADSTIEKTKVILYKEKALEFRDKLRNIDDSEKRFSLLKEYGLIPNDVNRDSLRQEMLNLAEELGITEERIESISKRYVNKGDDVHLIGINFLNEFGGISVATLNLPIGLSFITGILNDGYPDIPSADLLYIALYIVGRYDFYNGVLPDFHSMSIFGFFCLLGFIGFVVSVPFLAAMPYIYNGFTVASLAIPAIMGRP